MLVRIDIDDMDATIWNPPQEFLVFERTKRFSDGGLSDMKVRSLPQLDVLFAGL